MFEKKAIITVSLPAAPIYDYLRHRYESRNYRQASLAVKGYQPAIECRREEQNRHLEFWVRGRDALLKFPTSSWTWTYDLKPISDSETEVEIGYRYPWPLAIMGFGTIAHQAGSEIIETVLALDALAVDPESLNR